jgi:hypothetical protein
MNTSFLLNYKNLLLQYIFPQEGHPVCQGVRDEIQYTENDKQHGSHKFTDGENDAENRGDDLYDAGSRFHYHIIKSVKQQDPYKKKSMTRSS